MYSRKQSPSVSFVELTILMPCLNEARTLETCISKARKFIHDSGINAEVLIADNGSTDQSPAIARQSGARLVEITGRGYGSALLGGIKAARGEYIVIGDCDDSYDFSSLAAFLQHLNNGADLVVGNRFTGGIAPGAMPFLHRYFGNPALSWLERLLFRVPLGDFHCGLRGFNAQRIRALGLRTTGMEFATEMIVRSAQADYLIVEVPTTLQPDGRSRPSHLRTWRDGWRHLTFMLRNAPRRLLLYPGLVLSILAVMFMSMLAFGGIGL